MENRLYRYLHGIYWISFSVCHGYITYYLTRNGFTAAQVGILAAAGGTVAAFAQVFLGKLADKSARWNWKRLLQAGSAAGALFMIAVLFGSGHKWLTGISYAAFMVCVHAMMPLVNAACFYYRARGIDVNFGIARGTGSLVYAVFSFIMGYLTAWFGTLPVALSGIADMVLLFAIVSVMPLAGGLAAGPAGSLTEPAGREANTGAASAKPREGFFRGVAGFVRKYPSFFLMVLGLTLLMTFHNAITTYMLQLVERAGGDNTHLGTALSLCALFELPVMFGYGLLSRRFKPAAMLCTCGIMYILRALVLLFATRVWVIYFSQMMQLVTFALYAAASVYYTDEEIGREDAVTGQALMSDVETVGAVIGSLTGGFLIQAGGVVFMLKFMIAAAAAGAALIFLSTRYRNSGGKGPGLPG